MKKYEDIINLPHHQSATRPHMSVADRAAQFAPFAALTGYEDAIDETGRLTDSKLDLDEAALSELDLKLSELAAKISTCPQVTVTYFVPDGKKEGGEYKTSTLNLKKIDPVSGTLTFTNGVTLTLSDILFIA